MLYEGLDIFVRVVECVGSVCVCHLALWCLRGLCWEWVWLVIGECPECGVTGLLDAACGCRGFIVMVWFEFWWGL